MATAIANEAKASGKSCVTWTSKMAKVDSLISRGMGVLYERVKLLVEIEDDPDFLADCDDIGVTPEYLLNDKTADTGNRFATLKEVLNRFPRKKDWQSMSLMKMVAAVSLEQKRESQLKKRQHNPPAAELGVKSTPHGRHDVEPMEKQDAFTLDAEPDDEFSNREKTVVTGKQMTYGKWKIDPETCLRYIHRFHVDGKLDAHNNTLRPLMKQAMVDLREALGL